MNTPLRVNRSPHLPVPRRSANQLGQEIRDRRTALNLSVRALAEAAGVSPGYVAAIENGRSASTGRAPEVSLRVIEGLAAALDCTVIDLTGLPGHAESAHVLFYCLDEARALFAAVDREFGTEIDHWIYIADPRHTEHAAADRATICTWRLGDFPYATRNLEPQDILTALEQEVEAVAPSLAGRRIGLAIMDCSAVMRYVQNAADEVDLERHWHDGVHAIWQKHLGGGPAIDVCGYRHRDIEALGLTIDQLDTALTLITSHDQVIALERGGATVSGRAAIRRILAEARPAGVSSVAWHDLIRAAALSLA